MINTEIKFSYYNDNNAVVANIKCSDGDRHLLFFNNCDYINGVILFLILKYENEKIVINIDCHIEFWQEFIALYNNYNNTKTELIFNGKSRNILEDKIYDTDAVLMFTGGKDSVLTLRLLNEKSIIPYLGIFEYQMANYYLEVLHKNSFIVKPLYRFSSNIDNELYNIKKGEYSTDLILMLAILSKFKTNYVGINLDDLVYKYSIDFITLAKFLNKYGIKLQSYILDMPITTVIKHCENKNLYFKKCGGDDYCYKCTECAANYLYGGSNILKTFNPPEFVDLFFTKKIKNNYKSYFRKIFEGYKNDEKIINKYTELYEKWRKNNSNRL